MDAHIKQPRETNPRVKVNPLAAVFFVHLFPVFRKSFKSGFKEDDLYEHLKEHDASYLGDKLEDIWYQKSIKNKKTALHRALARMFLVDILLLGFYHLMTEMMYLFVMPSAVSGLVTYFGNGPTKVTDDQAYVYTALIIISIALYCIILHSVMMSIMHVAMKARLACCSLIYRKSLRLSHLSLSQTTTGHIVNLLSNDVSKIDNGILYVHYVWISPVKAIVGTYLLYKAIGIAAFAGMAFLVLFVPLQIYLGKRNSKVRLQTAIRTDQRVHVMGEVLSGMEAIKMYTWEKPFAAVVSAARRFEIKSIRCHYFLEAIMFSLELFVARTCIFISIVLFIFFGNNILASTAYTVTLIYGIIRQDVTKLFSFSIARIGEILTTINRLQEFMLFEDLNKRSHNRASTEENEKSEIQMLIRSTELSVNELTNPKVFLKTVSAKWVKESANNILSGINLNIVPGQLVAIIGPVGSGKSSMINVILKELPLSDGYLETEGVISYASQQAWLFSGSVRQNILFGAPYEEERYKNILKVCALEPDLKLLPYGDQSIVGEKGNSLSGGQKARVNLARCVYRRADIYLLDDPLSAVDTKVGKLLYDECITKFLSEKICILVTHQLQYLKNTDKIIILKHGKIVGDGSYKELQSSGLDFAKLLQEFNATEEEEDTERCLKSRENSELSIDLLESIDEPIDINKEKLEQGRIQFATYMSYFRSGGNYFVMILLLAVFVAAQGAGNGGDYFVRYWINLEQDISDANTSITDLYSNQQVFERREIIYIYSGIMFATIVLGLGHPVFFFLFFMRASINMHDSIFNKISNATMRFFNANPVGRILNRFAKDIGIIDEYLPFILIDVLQIGLVLLGSLTITSVVNPWLLLPTLGLLILFYFIRLVYVAASRNVKRLEGITRSPLFNHLTATMDGLTTIRAFESEKVLSKEFDSHQNVHSSAWYLTISTSRAFGFWIDVICTTFISLITISLLLINKDSYYGADIGLILTQYLNLTGVLQWGMRMWSELENNMTSVERVLEYTKVETEPVRVLNGTLPKDWPEFGKVVFQNVCLRYNPNDPQVLKCLSFTINAGEKIGIVGRTGAGKSSIIAALFQLYDIEGAIIIDGVDTTKIPLASLRENISIIPQTPVLFSGTMRTNLDPFDEFTDDVLWSALEEVELKDQIGGLGLHSIVSEGGSNFSIGQRQLVCLARAIVRNNRILVMDEATANVDPHTDALIQDTIRKKFAQCTVVTIAHRLNTVMDSDRILVMDSGMLLEYDHPHHLLQQSNSVFYSMVETTGVANSMKLRSIAEQSYLKTK